MDLLESGIVRMLDQIHLYTEKVSEKRTKKD